MHPVVVPLNVSWFSAGVSSAVATKLVRSELDMIIYTHIDDQHPDTMRFVRDCQKWFWMDVDVLASPYKSVGNALRQMRFINSPHGSACTKLLKRRVRQEWEMGITRPLVYFWGYDASEQDRADKVRAAMPKQEHRFPLIENGIGKEEAHQMLKAAGIKRPAMYDLGYHNNNCVGCVKGGKGYWNKIRVDFPEVFAARAELERRVGASCIHTKEEGRVFLDELDQKAGRHEGPICDDCGIMCEIFADAVHRHNPRVDGTADEQAKKEQGT